MTTQDYRTSQSVVEYEEELPSENNSATNSFSLIDFLTQLAHHKLQIAALTGTAMLAAALYSLILPNQYTATTKILTPQKTQSSAALLMSQMASIGANPLAAAAGGAGGLLKSPNDIYVGLLNSRPIADAIIQQFGLAHVYHTNTMTATRRVLAKNTKVVSEKTGFLAVSVVDEDKKRAASIANSYPEQLRVITKTLALTEATQRRRFYELQLKEAKEALVASEMDLQQVQQKKGMVQLDVQAKGMIESITAMRAKVAAQQVKVQDLRSYSTDRNPEVQLAERELSTLQTEVAGMEESSHSTGFTDLGLKDVPSASLEYLSAQHEVLYRQTLFDLLIKQYDAARLDEANDESLIQAVEVAIPPELKSSPHRMTIVLTCAILGFLVACAYSFVLDSVRSNPETVHSLAELKSAVLGR
jgi:uncharacterized protein involved in exopolysaccharide biosynthesis